MPRSSRLRPQNPTARRGHQRGSTGAILDAAKARVEKFDDSHEVKARNNPLDDDLLQREELQARMAYGRARREGREGTARVLPLMEWGLARLNRTRVMRSLNLFFFHYGTVMAAGAAYMMFFSVTAMLWAGFSVAGIIIGGNPGYQEFIIESVQEAVPGVIVDGGLISEDQARGLFTLEGLNVSLAIAVAVALVTSLSWLHGLRSGIRSIWERPLMAENVIFVKLKDFGMLIILGVIAIVAAVLGLLSHGLITQAVAFLGWSSGGVTEIVLQLVSFGISFLLDMMIAVILMRLASRLVMPVAALWQSALIAGIGASLLRLGSSQLLQNFVDSPNPLVNTFGTVLGVFFYFFLFGLVYLFAASWGAIAASDRAE